MIMLVKIIYGWILFSKTLIYNILNLLEYIFNTLNEYKISLNHAKGN